MSFQNKSFGLKEQKHFLVKNYISSNKLQDFDQTTPRSTFPVSVLLHIGQTTNYFLSQCCQVPQLTYKVPEVPEVVTNNHYVICPGFCYEKQQFIFFQQNLFPTEMLL